MGELRRDPELAKDLQAILHAVQTLPWEALLPARPWPRRDVDADGAAVHPLINWNNADATIEREESDYGTS